MINKTKLDLLNNQFQIALSVEDRLFTHSSYFSNQYSRNHSIVDHNNEFVSFVVNKHEDYACRIVEMACIYKYIVENV